MMPFLDAPITNSIPSIIQYGCESLSNVEGANLISISDVIHQIKTQDDHFDWHSSFISESNTSTISLTNPDPYTYRAQNSFTDPSLMDTDGDGLSDGFEVEGWENNVIFEKTKEKAFTISKEFCVGNPALVIPDGNSWKWVLDTDSDSVSDFDEFQNSSNPLMRDTDTDRIWDNEEGQGNHTQIEGTDPWIEGNIEANFVFHYVEVLGIKIPSYITIDISLTAVDNAGLDWVLIKCQGSSPRKVLIEDVDEFGRPIRSKEIVEPGFEADFAGAFWSGYDIEINVADVNGNGVKGKTHLDSIVEAVIKAILAALISFIEAVKELASKALEWIWGFLEKIFEPVIKPLKEAIVKLGVVMVLFIESAIETFLNITGRSEDDDDEPDFFGLGYTELLAVGLTLWCTVAILISVLFTIATWIPETFPPAQLIAIGLLVMIVLIVILAFTTEKVDESGIRPNNPEYEKSEKQIDDYVIIAGFIAGLLSFVFTLGLVVTKKKGMKFFKDTDGPGLFFAFIGLVFSSVSLYTHIKGIYINPFVSYYLAIIGLLLSGIGFVFALRVTKFEAPFLWKNIVVWGEEILGGIALTLGIYGFIRAQQDLPY